MKLAVAVCLAFVIGSSLASEWSYAGGDVDPAHWAEHYGSCGGTHQSPINIKTRNVEHQSDLYDFEFHNYNETAPLSLKLLNNGHAAQVNILGGNPYITGGGLPEKYKLAQFHFHWGSDETQGSEHTIDGHEYCMEMHWVHYAESREDLATAADKPQGLAVLGFLFEIQEQDNPNYEHLVSMLSQVQNESAEVAIEPFLLRRLMPRTFRYYFRYTGSLTTPGCYESVVWTVFRDTIKISLHQMHAFRELMAHGHEIVNNYRPVQPLNDRIVKYNGYPSALGAEEVEDGNSAPVSATASLVLALVAAALQRVFV